MREVAIVGVGSTAFGRVEGTGLVELAVAACREALADSRVPRGQIQALYVGNFVGERLASQGALAALLAGRLGLGGIPATKVEGACASGGIALRHGVLAIALGLYDFVLVAGAEKMTASPTPEVTAALATAGDEEREMRTGLTFPGAFGIIMREHMARHGPTRPQVGFVPKGKGGPAVEEGWTGLDGRVAVNPSGGLIAKGHPVGATGCAQVYELVRQLRGEAANQVRHAEVALAHNLGGTGVVSTVTILGRL